MLVLFYSIALKARNMLLFNAKIEIVKCIAHIK